MNALIKHDQDLMMSPRYEMNLSAMCLSHLIVSVVYSACECCAVQLSCRTKDGAVSAGYGCVTAPRSHL